MNDLHSVIHILLDFPFQQVIAANMFAFIYPKKKFFLLREIVFFLPMILVYDYGVKQFGYNILENPVLDKCLMLIPALWVFLGIRFCYKCSVTETFFCTASAHPLQNLVFSVIELVQVQVGYPQDGIIDLMFSMSVVTIVYAVVYYFFRERNNIKDGYEAMSVRLTINSVIILLYVIFLYGMAPNHDPVVLIVFISCDILALIMQYSLLSELTSKWQYEVVEQLLYAERKKYQQLSATTEIINRKCHDLKYLVAGLRQMEDGPERRKYYDEIENAVMIYGNAVKSGNETLDLLLMDKMLYCEEHHIKLTCVADGSGLNWMDTIDLYTLFGNALDNAIESVSREEDESKRIISFRVGTSGQMVSIHFENYVGQEVKMKDGWPVTSKEDKQYHGFGMLSIRRIVEKYGGTVSIRAENNVFRLNILFPGR